MEYHSNKNAFTVIQSKNNTLFNDLPIQLKYEVAN